MYIGKWKITKKDLVWFIVCLIIILCFLIGVFICNDDGAADILSGASTAVSIVLSVVAILYTMIEGANSTKVNQESINKLESIDSRLQEVTEKLIELKNLDRRLRNTIPKIDSTVQKIEQKYAESEIDAEVKENVQMLLAYIGEDIDE